MGISNSRYGEVVGAFLEHSTGTPSVGQKPTDEEIRTWTRQALGWHKAPVHIFWLGEDGVPNDIPQTGSGKIKKFELRVLGEAIIASREGGQRLTMEKGAKL